MKLSSYNLPRLFKEKIGVYATSEDRYTFSRNLAGIVDDFSSVFNISFFVIDQIAVSLSFIFKRVFTWCDLWKYVGNYFYMVRISEVFFKVLNGC